MSSSARTIWLYGLPGAGKTTLGLLVAGEMRNRGLSVIHLDGDEARKTFNSDLGFSRADRHAACLRVAWVAEMFNLVGVNVVVSQISPYQQTRDAALARLDRPVEVFLDCPLEQVINRDPKGLYKKALAGEISGVTGVDDPFEPPQSPTVRLRTDLSPPEECLAVVTAELEAAGILAWETGTASGAYSEDEEEQVKKRLKSLGYM